MLRSSQALFNLQNGGGWRAELSKSRLYSSSPVIQPWSLSRFEVYNYYGKAVMEPPSSVLAPRSVSVHCSLVSCNPAGRDTQDGRLR